MRKKHAAGQGIVASANLGTVFQREIFFAVDPATLDWMDHQEVMESQPSSMYVEYDILPLIEYLPEVEAEIFWLINVKGKHQKDVAELLGLSQPTISYRWRRVLVKLRYLMTLAPTPLRRRLEDIECLKEEEVDILYDLFFIVNQELVARKYDRRQSSVKWVFTKSLKFVRAKEREDPEKWFDHLALLLLLENNFNIRLQS